MKIVLTLIITILTIKCDQLRFVIEQYRHGARGTFNGQYLNNTSPFEDYMAGELTTVGQRQHYVLGQKLREDYGDYLSESYNQDEIKVRATDVNRTLQSAESQLYGLFPNGYGLEIPPQLDPSFTIPPYKGAKPVRGLGDNALPEKYQPIPIHSVTEEFDTLLKPTSETNCPNYNQILSDWQHEDQQIKNDYLLQNEFKFAARDLSELLKQDIQVSDFQKLRDNIICDLNAGLQDSIPDELQPGTDLYQQVDFVSDYKSYLNMNCPECRKIVNTDLFLQYIQYLDGARQGNKSFKWYMVSAHDTNLQYVLPLLNITNADCLVEIYQTGETDQLNCHPKPQFAANLIIELHESDNSKGEDSDFNIVIKYNGEPQYLCEQKSTTCQYSEWRQRILDSIYTKEEHELVCGLVSQKQEKKNENIITVPINFDGEIINIDFDGEAPLIEDFWVDWTVLGQLLIICILGFFTTYL